MARIYAVASAKGGVGKTTTTANLGAALAASGYSVAIVDGDLAMPNLAATAGVDVSDATIHDVLAGRASVDDATYRSEAGVDVVPGDDSLDAFAAADPTALRTVLSELESYDFVLVDTGSGLTHDAVLPLGLADAVFLVCNTERDALGDTDKTREVTQRLGGTVGGVVLTRVDPDNPNASEVATRLNATVIEAIPSDDAVTESVAASVPVSAHAPDSPAAAAYAALAEAVEAYEPGAEVTTRAEEANEAESDTAEPEDGEPEGAELESAEPEGAEPEGAEPEDAEADDTESVAATEGTLSIASAEAKLGVDSDEFAEEVDDDERDQSTERDEPDATDVSDAADADPIADAIVEAEGTTDASGPSENDGGDAADATDESTAIDGEEADIGDDAEAEVDASDDADTDEESGVYDTALVEEAENMEAEADESDGDASTDDGGPEQENEEENEEASDEETGGKDRGFLGRLLR